MIMVNKEIKKELKSIAGNLGIKELGFTAAVNAEADTEKYKTAISALFPYYISEEPGNISMYARGLDYHRVIREKLLPPAEYLKSCGAEYADIYGDTGGLNDRRAAVFGGLGFMGKNGMVISDKYGSYVFIGIILTDMEFEYDEPDLRSCLGCGACEKSCIGKAIDIENGFAKERCVSYISQKKGSLTDEERALILKSGMCWGCDVCQQVCPYNRGLSDTVFNEFRENRVLNIQADEIYGISNREFMRRYRNYAFSWRGIKPLLRNLRILENKREA